MKEKNSQNLNLLEFIVTIVFFIEIVIKVLTLKKQFFQNFYNKSDLVVFICNAIAIILSLILDKNL